MFYILDDRRRVTEADDFESWCLWMESIADRRVVAKYEFGDNWEISTVFIGIDHRPTRFLDEDGPPLVFETMVFCGGIPHLANYRRHYPTWVDAVSGHEQVVNQVADIAAEN